MNAGGVFPVILAAMVAIEQEAVGPLQQGDLHRGTARHTWATSSTITNTGQMSSTLPCTLWSSILSKQWCLGD
jgi:hypothetical protein